MCRVSTSEVHEKPCLAGVGVCSSLTEKKQSKLNSPAWVTGVSGTHRLLWADALVGDREVHKIKHKVGLGFRNRASVDGPEQELVNAFLESEEFKLQRGRQLTVFSQPAVETGYPDLVAVVWRPKVARTWNQERLKLQRQDLKLLHLLTATGWVERSFLKGLYPKGLKQSLRRLELSDLVICRTHKCRARSLNKIFAVEQIVAVEAKVSSWRKATEQASNNLWFSSQSYILLPGDRLHHNLLNEVKPLKVGVLGQEVDGIMPKKEAATQPVPTSYCSWVFNEWVWRIGIYRGQFQDT